MNDIIMFDRLKFILLSLYNISTSAKKKIILKDDKIKKMLYDYYSR